MLIDDCLAEPGNSNGEGMRAVCIREVQKDLAQSSKALIETKLTEFRLGEADGFKVFRDVIQTPGDGLIMFKGMQDYTAESIKSLEGVKRAWWEEAQAATKHSVGLLRPTIRAPGSQMWWSWNARRRTDPVDEMLRGAERPTGALVVQANWRDNPWFTKELEQERQDCLRMTPDDYDHIWEGGYVQVADGAYYARQLTEARAAGRIGNLSPDPLMQYKAFWDIGTRDATAIWVAQFVGREIRVLDHYEASGQPLATHLNWLRASGYDKCLCVLPHDGANENHVTATRFEDHIKAAGFPTKVVPNQGKGAAIKRVEAARRLFPSIWFHEPKTTAGLEALGWYHERKDEHRNIGLGPEHDWSSHSADAFGLMCISFSDQTANEGWGSLPKTRVRVV